MNEVSPSLSVEEMLEHPIPEVGWPVSMYFDDSVPVELRRCRVVFRKQLTLYGMHTRGFVDHFNGIVDALADLPRREVLFRRF